METKEFRTVDKSKWGEGPWQSEPDKKQWQDAETGFPCLLVRGPSGALCGYVGVPPGHPAFGLNYDSLSLDVHGGLTFSNSCRPGATEAEGICHTPSPGEPDHVWWLGFDCAHAWDYTPAFAEFRSYPRSSDDIYRDQKYVETEVARLAKQLVVSRRSDQ